VAGAYLITCACTQTYKLGPPAVSERDFLRLEDANSNPPSVSWSSERVYVALTRETIACECQRCQCYDNISNLKFHVSSRYMLDCTLALLKDVPVDRARDTSRYSSKHTGRRGVSAMPWVSVAAVASCIMSLRSRDEKYRSISTLSSSKSCDVT
jgi:hypothetical protein